MLDFQGYLELPGLETIRQTTEAQVWFGRFEQQVFMPAVIDGTNSADSGATPTDLIRIGSAMGMITSTKKLVPWNPTASNGSEKVYGILCQDLKMQNSGNARDRLAWVLVKGNLKSTGVRLRDAAGATATSLLSAGSSVYEPLFRAYCSLAGKFLLDDQPEGVGTLWGGNRLIDLNDVGTGGPPTTAYTLTEADNGTVFHTTGVSADFAVTVPSAAAYVGFSARFLNVADFQLQLTFTSGQLIAFNDAAANTVSYTTAGDHIGGAFDIYCISTTKWFVIPHCWADGVMVQTITLTT